MKNDKNTNRKLQGFYDILMHRTDFFKVVRDTATFTRIVSSINFVKY